MAPKIPLWIIRRNTQREILLSIVTEAWNKLRVYLYTDKNVLN